MKFLNTGDWHITDKRPENRIDNYWKTILRKINFIMTTAKNRKVDYILQPGDLTDTPALSYEAFSEIIDLITTTTITTWGQHDLRFRHQRNTALRALSKSTNIEILSNGCGIYNAGVNIIGCAYNEEIPNLKEGDDFNILLIHKMIVEEKIWNAQQEFEWANSFLRRNKFDLIVSGDNHQYFTATTGKRFLFNCGSLLRSSIAQIDHQPKIIIFDTDTRKYEIIDVPIEPAEKVFKLSNVIKEKERDEKIEAFVNGLSEQKEMSLSFEDNLNIYVKENKIDSKIVDIIKGCMT